jgi:transcriptional regulator with PAS, ATPase and Fis domain
VEANCKTILITGETGTGKEVVAQEIHRPAHAESAPFIAVSCPVLTPTLMESELFGSVKGSFTSATENRKGYFEMADRGTLFLDEIGDFMPSGQAALLRVLETRAFRRIGGDREISVDIRVVAATNAPLADRIKSGTFRQDLFYRLNRYIIHIPPLSERCEDIHRLLNTF